MKIFKRSFIMKKALTLVLSLVMVFTLGACGDNSSGSPSSTSGTAPQSSVVSDNSSTPDISSSSQSDESEDAAGEGIVNESAPEDTSTEDSTASSVPNIEPTTNASNASSGTNILVAYFTVPESDGVDAVARASRVVVDGKVVGNTQFIAGVIQDAVGGDLFEIKTVEEYPVRPALMDLAANEQRQNARPELSTKIENLANYDVIFLGYPNWNADLPQPLYTFLEQYDFSGKTIIPFCPHGGSGFSNTISTISKLQPNATVVTNGFSVSRESVPISANDVTAWVQGLNITQ